MAESELETKKFIHELQAFVELVGCTTLLLTGESRNDEQYALRTMVDGLIELRCEVRGMEAARSIELTKFRGSRTLLGRHLMEISDDGVCIYPRTEALHGTSLGRGPSGARKSASLGIPGLDAILDGGLRPGSVSMVVGPPGSGKTLLGLTLLSAGAKVGEAGLYFGFSESPADLTRRATAIGLDLATPSASGLVEVMCQSPLSAIADALSEKLFAAVTERGVKRLFIDGLGGFRETLVYPERTTRFFTALCNELRARGVVTMLSDGLRSLAELDVDGNLVGLLDNIVSLSPIEGAASLRQLIAVTKVRDGGGDRSARELSIGARGFVVGGASPAPRAKRSSKRAAKGRRR